MTVLAGIKIISGIIIAAEGAMKIVDKVAKCKKVKVVKKNKPRDDLIDNFEAFKQECMKSNKSALKALKMMNELEEMINDEMGIDPTVIDVTIEEVEQIPQIAGA